MEQAFRNLSAATRAVVFHNLIQRRELAVVKIADPLLRIDSDILYYLAGRTPLAFSPRVVSEDRSRRRGVL